MLENLLTEQNHPASQDLHRLPTAQILNIISDADSEVSTAVRREIPAITMAVDAIAGRMENGGRLFYIGSGTSGRLGVLDAAECPPTFFTPPELVQALIAGGDRALRRSAEAAEDDP